MLVTVSFGNTVHAQPMKTAIDKCFLLQGWCSGKQIRTLLRNVARFCT